MLSIAALEDILDTIEYRPGWEFSVYEDEFEGPHIFIFAPTHNAHCPAETVDLGVRSPLPPFETEKEFLRWLSWRLRRLESHESREWLRQYGKAIFDPHEPS